MTVKLLQGGESQERFDLLISLTSIKSDDMIRALRLHLVNGMSLSDMQEIFDIHVPNVRRALKTLNEVNTKIERIKEIDYRKQSAK